MKLYTFYKTLHTTGQTIKYAGGGTTIFSLLEGNLLRAGLGFGAYIFGEIFSDTSSWCMSKTLVEDPDLLRKETSKLEDKASTNLPQSKNPLRIN